MSLADDRRNNSDFQSWVHEELGVNVFTLDDEAVDRCWGKFTEGISPVEAKCNNFLQGLAKIADALDGQGLHQEAEELDGIIKEMSQEKKSKPRTREELLAQAIGLSRI